MLVSWCNVEIADIIIVVGICCVVLFKMRWCIFILPTGGHLLRLCLIINLKHFLIKCVVVVEGLEPWDDVASAEVNAAHWQCKHINIEWRFAADRVWRRRYQSEHYLTEHKLVCTLFLYFY